MPSSRRSGLRSVCIIAERWPVAPFAGQFPDPSDGSVVVRYRVDFRYRRYSVRAEENHTVVVFDHDFTERHGIGRGGGGVSGLAAQALVDGDTARCVLGLVNHLIDLVQGTFEETDENPFPHIRRVGVRDFVSLDTFPVDSEGNQVGQGMSLANLALSCKVAERTVGIVSRVDSSTVASIPPERIKILRAVELLNGGYHTEALLVAFALLDSYVQQGIEELLAAKGVADPRVFSRLVRERRMATFLGPVLRSLCGRSLQEDEPTVWENLEKANTDRNRAMHDSRDIPYWNAKRGIETTRDVLVYLGAIRGEHGATGDKSRGQDLGIERLPFFFEFSEGA
jgi:hypothetical protein